MGTVVRSIALEICGGYVVFTLHGMNMFLINRKVVKKARFLKTLLCDLTVHFWGTGSRAYTICGDKSCPTNLSYKLSFSQKEHLAIRLTVNAQSHHPIMIRSSNKRLKIFSSSSSTVFLFISSSNIIL